MSKRAFAVEARRAYPLGVQSNDVDALRERLRAVGLRATSARLAVLRCLVDAHAPLSHAEVYDIVAGLGFDRATTYRNLVDITESGLARRTDHGDRTFRFELAGVDARHDTDAHAHFICNSCGTVECLPDAAVAVSSGRGVPRSLRQRHVEIQVRGKCDHCV